MPRRRDLEKILLVGSGPIVIGQACEFDYSGTQALRALKQEGFQVILLNSNPATIMTDPQLSDRVYIEPLTPQALESVILQEKPDAILPTMGGQTALNLTMSLYHSGRLEALGVEILGAKPSVIEKAENREQFKKAMAEIGIECAQSQMARSIEDGHRILKEMGLPLILRPSFTLGGEGGGTCFTSEEFLKQLERALFLSPTREVLVEESLLGWKEYELEVVRDRNDNVVIICSIENLDPMGVHTGDSITVAPAQTLTDREFQTLRDASIRIIREIGVETGGSNIQFAVHPKTGRMIVIEMNPRVSRSSALASKATGFPIARVAAKLAVGYTLDELTNDITGSTPCSFEPSLDYVVTKMPRFDFEKFRPTRPLLGTQMKSVGEVMAIGRTFEESLGKAIAGLEVDPPWFAPSPQAEVDWEKIKNPHPRRIWAIADALRKGTPSEKVCEVSGIDPWFIARIRNMVLLGEEAKQWTWPWTDLQWKQVRAKGWTDVALASLLGRSEMEIRENRTKLNVRSVFQSVDTCAAEFEAKTPYLYSSSIGKEESRVSSRNKVMILGGGPNRIGQGIEFDYCCVHSAMALRQMGYETIMVNSNPETVSTDFDISDKLYFEPLTVEHVLAIAEKEKPMGVIVQFGGQTPLKLAGALHQAGLKVLGTSPESIDLAEDRGKCEGLVRDLSTIGLYQPEAAFALSATEARERAQQLGFPLLVRPSYVLGGKGMRVIYDEDSLKKWIEESMSVSEKHPVLMDRFLNKAIEVDVDALSDGKETVIAGLMEHIEEAGIHSGDSACVLPPASLSLKTTEKIRTFTRELAKRFQVVGLMNIQFAVQGEQVFLLEVNPRASRTVPFVSKAIGKPLAQLATQVILGRSLRELGITGDLDLGLSLFNVKAPVFPFHKFPGVDVILGPEMKSTGEVMGRGLTFAAAYAKALRAAGVSLPTSGRAFLSIRDEDKAEMLPVAKTLHELNFEIYATSGTERFLSGHGLKVNRINKFYEGSPHCVEAIARGDFSLIVNTVSDETAIRDSFSIRRLALERQIPYSTVVASARMMVEAIREQNSGDLEIIPL